MRVALVHPFHWDDVRRGGERYLKDLAGYLAAEGVDVDVVTGTAGQARTEVDGRLTVRRLTHRPSALSASAGLTPLETFGFAALGTLRRGRFDVVHSLTPTAQLAARVTRARTVYTCLGYPTAEQYRHRRRDRALLVRAVRSAQVPCAFSPAAADATAIFAGRTVTSLPLGVWSSDFPALLTPRTGPPRILFAGFPGDARKGVGLALAAMPAILDANPDASLVLLGDRSHHAHHHADLGDDRERVLRAVQDIGVRPMSDMPRLYREATVAILPSRHEALGISLVEALTSGTPVACSDDGGMTSIVSDPAVGRLHRTGDAGDLARAVREAIELARLPGTPQRCVDHARAWDWTASVGPAHLVIYEKAMRLARR